MADLPVPGPELTGPGGDARPGEVVAAAIPPAVLALLERLWSAGFAAYVVGGSVRDVLLGRVARDWDLATNAKPDRTLRIFPGSVYENAFGTVAVRQDDDLFEITTFRTDHDYADFRRPHRVEFGDTIELDLARRDFTINAMAWGAHAGNRPELVDPYDGVGDVASRTLRAVGDPLARFEEDALRMVRAVRLAATLDVEIEPATLDAIRTRAERVRYLSGERVATELGRILAAPRPSVAFQLMADTGVLAHVSTELARQRGIPQNKIEGEDLWDHTLRAVDAARADRPVLRLAALLHDIGKPATFAEGHFLGHDVVGADLAGELLDRLRMPRAVRERVVHLVRQHMFSYEPAWSDAAVRRFIGKIGAGEIDELFELRRADNIGSGLDPEAGGLGELRRRVDAELAGDVVLDRRALAIDGRDLIEELGLEEGPALGRILDGLVERVIVDPALNDRATLLLVARSEVEDA